MPGMEPEGAGSASRDFTRCRQHCSSARRGAVGMTEYRSAGDQYIGAGLYARSGVAGVDPAIHFDVNGKPLAFDLRPDPSNL